MKSRLIIAAMAATALFAAVSCGSGTVETPRTIGILAHRGYWNCEEAGYTRNSVASLRCAQEAGFWGAEFDLHLTSDEKIVVVHDDVIDGKRIEDTPYSEFENVTLENGEKLPTIDDYFAQGAKNPKFVLVIEIKRHSTPEREDRLLELTFEKMKEYGLYDPSRVAFVSFGRHIVDTIAEQLPDFMVQYVDSNYSPAELHETGVKGVSYQCHVFHDNPDWLQQAHDRGMTVNCWNVNDRDNLLDMMGIGVDLISSDDPMLVREILGEQNIREL